MRNTKVALQGAAAFVALIVVAGLFFWWQQQDNRVATPGPQPTVQAGGGVAPAGGETTITLAVEDANLAAYRPLMEQFEAQHGNIRVRLAPIGEIVSGETPDHTAALASAADVFAHSPNRQGGAQYLLDLRPFLDLNPQFDRSDFHSGLLPPVSEPLWVVPTEAMYYVTFYDQSAFDAAGLPYPEPDWTPEEFLATAQTLTQREDGEVARWGYIPGQLVYSSLLAAQLNAPLGGAGGSRLADPDVVAAVQWTADLFTRHQVAPWLEDYKPADMRSGSGPSAMGLVDDGMAAMWHTTHVLFDPNSEHMGVAAVPHNQAGVPAEPIVSGFAVSRGTASPQAAWQLLDFLSRQPPLSLLPYPVNPVPARQSVAAAANYWQQIPEPLLSALQYTVANNLPPRITSPEAETVLQALAEHIDAGVPVAEALGAPAAAPAAPPEIEEPVIVIPTPLPEDDEETVRITFATSWDLYEAHQELVRAFNETHSDFQVTVKRIDTGNDYHSEIAGADCFAAISSRLAGINAYARPVNALLDLDAVMNVDDFYPAAISTLTADGELLGLPGQIAVPLMAYNRDLFAAAGVAEPSLDWTLTEFLEIAQALTDPSIEQYGFIDWSQTTSLYYGLSQFGIEPISARDGVATVDFAAMAPVVRWYADLTHLYGVHPTLPGDLVPWQDFFDRHDLFRELVRNNQVAMWPNEATPPDDFANIDLGLVPLPLGPSGYRASLADGLTAYFIAADTAHTQLCWQWLRYLIAQPAAGSVNSVPAYRATAESAAFADYVGTEQAAILLAAIANNQEKAAWDGQFEPWLSPAMIWLESSAARAARGEVDVDSALAAAADNFAHYRECVIERQAFDDTAEWQACAVEVDPDLRRRYE